MSIYLFWDKYDRLTTYKSFFEAEYRLLTPELSSRDYEHIIATKLCEDLADDFLNALKLTMIRIFELLETSYTSELYLCSQKRLIKFMENVLQYIKIERIYLSYLEYPLKTGVPAGENTLINSLLRFRSLLKDFKTIFGFNSSKEIEDFENAKELIGNFANYFKLGFGELKSYCVALKQQNPYAHELMLINEVLTTCDELKYQPQPKYVEEVNESMMSKSDDFDGLSAILGNGNSSADYKTQLKNVMETTSGKPDGLSYKRLEPEYLMKASYDPSSIARESTKRTNGAGAAQVTESESKSLEEAKYDFYKYDKEFKDNKPPAPKGKQAKEQQPKEEISVFSILNKGRVGQDKRLFNTLPETQKKTVASQYSSSTVKNFPLTHYLDRFRDDENTELLALVNIDFDPHHGMKLTTNAAQQAKLKQRAEELEERIANSSDRNPRLTEEEQRRTTQVQENSSFDGDEDIESDSDLDDLDLRDRRMMLERRRRNLNTQTDMEFHQLPTGLHGEPTLINNYAFYENTLLKYEKPTREYLKETETVLERPTVAVDEIQSDFAFRESSPRSSRRKFLANVFGNTFDFVLSLIQCLSRSCGRRENFQEIHRCFHKNGCC